MKHNNCIVGIYVRLSRDDERAGESLSIENQKSLLVRYVNEKGWILHDIYVDDGISGTTFEREGVQRLLTDAKCGIINTIVVKDMSRFGRNYIQIGQYIDYVFPMYHIRFIAVSDNIDTGSNNTIAMDMMPITNVFNEWYAANTSRKVRQIFIANAKRGKSNMSHPPYGYLFSDDGSRKFVINTEVSANVERIFEMRAGGLPPARIAERFNEEHITTPQDYKVQRLGKYAAIKTYHLWTDASVRKILENPAYIGNLALQRRTSVSFKNHKAVYRPEEEWIVTENAHPAIISKELWRRVKEVEKSVSQGKKTRKGYTHPLSGFLYCADCGGKMKLNYYALKHNGEVTDIVYTFNCGNHKRLGKAYCSSHYIKGKDIEKFILDDVKAMASCVTLNEAEVRKKYLERKTKLAEDELMRNRKELDQKRRRCDKLDQLIETAFEEKIAGNMPEDLCVKLIERYSTERQQLLGEIEAMDKQVAMIANVQNDVDDFIMRVKKHMFDVTLTRALCFELIDKIVIGRAVSGEPQSIGIYYKVDLNLAQ